jgi:dTMP kinase
MQLVQPCQRGMLVSIEGITGTGKTYLTRQLCAAGSGPAAGAAVIGEFSARPARGDLGHDLLHALATAASGDPFLRGGSPAAETLLLLAIKTHDYEARCLPALRQGRLVLEGRSLHCIAAYQSLILHPDDDQQARAQMHTILSIAAQWRPLPDLTFLITDDPDTAIGRAEQRDGTTFTPADRQFHHRVAGLLDQLAADQLGPITVIDRRRHATAAALDLMRSQISERQHHLTCLRDSEPAAASTCGCTCALTEAASAHTLAAPLGA